MLGRFLLAAIITLTVWLCAVGQADASITTARLAAHRAVAHTHVVERFDYRRPTVYHHGAETASTAAAAWHVALAWHRVDLERRRTAAADARCGPWLCQLVARRALAPYGPAAILHGFAIIYRESHWQRAVCNPGVPCPAQPASACGLTQIMPEHGLGYACTNALVNLHWMTNHVRTGDWSPWAL